MEHHEDVPVTSPPHRQHVVVCAGGDAPHAVDLTEPDFVIAADSGVETAFTLGLTPGVVVGDLDSATPQALARARRLGVEIVAHPRDKDRSDLELALGVAQDRGATAVTVIGGDGGRISHLLTNASVLAAPRFSAMRIVWLTVSAEITVLHGPTSLRIQTSPHDLLSLVAVHGDAGGVSVSGARWPLEGVTVPAGASLGLSNQPTGSEMVVRIGTGSMLVIHERQHQ